ncbi:MAG: uracil-DNA glycosylase [Halorhodospira sp.]
MDTRRLRYLQRLGVDCYLPREAAVVEPGLDAVPRQATAPAATEPAPSRGTQAAAPHAVAESSSPSVAGPLTGSDAAAGKEGTRKQAAVEGAAAGSGDGHGADGGGSAPSAGGDGAVEPPEAAVPDCASMGWDELAGTVASCQACRLSAGRTQTVFGTGDQGADLVVVGEGPGAEEDRQGEPFVGRAGKLLDAMLAAIHRSREGGVYIANIVKCRPPGNRDPRPDEVAACSPYLDRQLALLEPKVIVALGRVAAQQLLATKSPLAKLRGRVHYYGAQSIPVWVTYHPAYLLRSPGEKAKAWQDLKQVRALVEGDSARSRTPPA